MDTTTALVVGLPMISLAICAVGSTAPGGADERQTRLHAFDMVWGTIKDHYFDPDLSGVDWLAARQRYRPLVAVADSDDRFYELLNEMLFALGVSHLAVIPPDHPEQLSSPVLMSPGDIGVELRMLGEDVVVNRMRPHSPAEEAGLRPGARIQAIGDRPIADLVKEVAGRLESFQNLRQSVAQEAMRLLFGEPGTDVAVAFLDAGGRQHEATVTRAARPDPREIMPGVPPIYVEFEQTRLAGGIGYVRFNCFHPALLQDILAAIDSMGDAPGLIIDIRGNDGGAFSVRKAIAEKLVAERTLFWVCKRRGSEERVFLDPAKGAFTGPLVVLVDVLSRSSSEEFSGSLQAIGRATVVGERTPGHVLRMEVEQLPTEAIFVYPVAQTCTPDGTVLEGRGVIPDVEAELDIPSLARGEDPQLEAALEFLGRTIGSE